MNTATAGIRAAIIFAGIALLCPRADAVRAKQAAPLPLVVPNQIVVKYRESASRDEILDSLSKSGIRGHLTPRGPNPDLLHLDKGQRIKAVLRALRANPAVRYAERVYYRYPQSLARAVPNDPRFSQQWAWDNSGADLDSVPDADMDMPEAWQILHDAPDIKVAIVDDGFDLTHEDLQGNFDPGGGVSCIDGTCTDGTTAADQDTKKEYHGTLVAGVLGAVGNNGTGMAGAIWHGNLLPIRTDLRSDSLAAAVRYAVDHGARIINMSLGGPVATEDERSAIDYARQNGVLIVVAAGNHDSDLDYSVFAYPANYDLPNIIAAAASDKSDDIAYFSQWGSYSVDVAAPGVDMLSTDADGGYASASGTSFSSPATAGVAALVAQHLKDVTGTLPDYRTIKAHLLAGAELAGDTGEGGIEGRVATGRINAYKALTAKKASLLVIKNVTISDDPALYPADNGDGLIDPGETVNLNITLDNVWQDESDVRGTLISRNTFTTAAPTTQDFGAIVAAGDQDGTATQSFPVTVNDFTGNQHLLFELDITTSSGNTFKRYFYLNVGRLDDNKTLNLTMQRTNWDEFQNFHIDVPTGATDLVIYTHTANNTDIDLLARYAQHPEFNIALGVDPEGDDAMFYVDNDPDHPKGHTKISGNKSGDESIGFADATQAGVYQIVTVNYADFEHPYDITACYAPAGSDQVSFTGSNTEILENDKAGSVTLSVTRSGTSGPASVDYTTQDGTALAGTNYKTVSGTLTWADGDDTTKTISVPIIDSGAIGKEASDIKRFEVMLSNPTGDIKFGCLNTTTVSLTGPDKTQSTTSGGDGNQPPPPTPPPQPQPPPSSGSGGGGGALGLLALLALLSTVALRRRGRRG
ncbi:MAG TPA: S8 family serine peptidase [Gammaproteobacteria bacterium]|nr:S8 family serine peptidase [Gammaproteobacteria bacterium]